VIGWVKWLIFILSLCIPPFGVITFWIFSGRDDEQKMIGKWALVAAFIGVVIWAILAAFGVTMNRMMWGGMGRW